MRVHRFEEASRLLVVVVVVVAVGLSGIMLTRWHGVGVRARVEVDSFAAARRRTALLLLALRRRRWGG